MSDRREVTDVDTLRARLLTAKAAARTALDNIDFAFDAFDVAASSDKLAIAIKALRTIAGSQPETNARARGVASAALKGMRIPLVRSKGDRE